MGTGTSRAERLKLGSAGPRRYSPLRASFWLCPQRAANRNRPTKMHKNRHIEKAQPRAVAIQGIQSSYDLGGSAPALSRSMIPSPDIESRTTHGVCPTYVENLRRSDHSR